MELGLSLGTDTTSSKPVGISPKNIPEGQSNSSSSTDTNSLSFCMALGGVASASQENEHDHNHNDEQQRLSLQLNLLPLHHVPRPSPSSSDKSSSDNGSTGNMALPAARGLDMITLSRIGGGCEEVSSPNSVAALPLQMEFTGFHRNSTGNGIISGTNKRNFDATGNDAVDAEIAGSRVSDEDENGVNARRKLRLTKEQSAFLEESFKEHNTLNPKQKLALVKQLNLRPRQVEVWFQNRRARTKLKQTEVDCEYLKKCCERLTEENRRLHKELQELRALKSSSPFYMQLPATTLTMCPSCERVATTSTAPNTTATTPTSTTATGAKTSVSESTLPKAIPFLISKQSLFPFSSSPSQSHESAAS